MTDILDSNSDTRPFELSQFAAWMLVDGMRERLEHADNICWVDTIETELDRLEEWCIAHSPWHEEGDFDEFRVELVAAREHFDREDREWYAEQRRKAFTVIGGGKL